MKNQLWKSAIAGVALILLTTSVPLSSANGEQTIEHAPTTEQCHADQKVWLSEVDDQSAIDRESFHTLDQRVAEMSQCEQVDSRNKAQYYITAAATRSEQSSRMANYLNRHNLFEQFIAEDTAGKR
jgi:hypothetical protein